MTFPEIVKKMLVPIQKNTAFFCAVEVFLLCYTAAYWLGGVNTVDPIHYQLYFYSDMYWRLPVVFLPLVIGCFMLFRRQKAAPEPIGLLCAAGAFAATFFAAFSSLAVSLILLVLACWRTFSFHPFQVKENKFWLLAPIGLFIYVFTVGLEQQISAYNRLILLFYDWGIYFSGYRDLAENPGGFWGRWFCQGNHWNPFVNMVMAGIIGSAPRVLTVFIVNSLVLASAVPLCYALGRVLKLPGALCALIAAGAALNPLLSNQHTALIYGYHPIYFCLPLFLIFLICWEKKWTWGMVLTGISLCGIKETVFIFALGSFFIFGWQKKWKNALGAAVVSVGLFYLVTQVLLPRCDETGSFFQLFQYQGLGKSFSEILTAPICSPGVFWGKLLHWEHLIFVLLLLLPVLPSALFAPEFLLAALPLLGGVLLKDTYQGKFNIVQQYAFEITAWLICAFIYGLVRLFQRKQLTGGLIGAFMTGLFLSYFFYGKTPFLGTYSAAATRRSPDVRVIRERLRKIIPPEAVVATSQKWAAQLVESHKNIRWEIDSPEADFRVIDFSDGFLGLEKAMRLRDRLLKERTEYPVTLFNARGCRIVVFKKGQGNWTLPFIVPGSPEKLVPQGKNVPVSEPGLRARAVLIPQTRKLLLFWSTVPGFDKDVVFTVTLSGQGAKQVFKLNWGYGLYPAYEMKLNQCFVMELPIPPGWQNIDGLNVGIETINKPGKVIKK